MSNQYQNNVIIDKNLKRMKNMVYCEIEPKPADLDDIGFGELSQENIPSMPSDMSMRESTQMLKESADKNNF